MMEWRHPDYPNFLLVACSYCPSFTTTYVGWRKLLIQAGMPRRWFRPHTKEVCLYRAGNTVICSPENFWRVRIHHRLKELGV